MGFALHLEGQHTWAMSQWDKLRLFIGHSATSLHSKVTNSKPDTDEKVLASLPKCPLELQQHPNFNPLDKPFTNRGLYHPYCARGQMSCIASIKPNENVGCSVPYPLRILHVPVYSQAHSEGSLGKERGQTRYCCALSRPHCFLLLLQITMVPSQARWSSPRRGRIIIRN